MLKLPACFSRLRPSYPTWHSIANTQMTVAAFSPWRLQLKGWSLAHWLKGKKNCRKRKTSSWKSGGRNGLRLLKQSRSAWIAIDTSTWTIFLLARCQSFSIWRLNHLELYYCTLLVTLMRYEDYALLLQAYPNLLSSLTISWDSNGQPRHSQTPLVSRSISKSLVPSTAVISIFLLVDWIQPVWASVTSSCNISSANSI